MPDQGWENGHIQGDRCCQLSGRMGKFSIFEAAFGGAVAKYLSNMKTVSYFLATRAVLQV